MDKQHNPNVGENQVHHSGNSEGGRSSGMSDSAGVTSGLGSLESADVKNLESVCVNQRPKGRTESAGKFKLGTL